jgi:Family of unknown function (DUF5681)
MAKNITNPGQWQAGQSGNPKGRPRRGRPLTELLRLKGEMLVYVGGQTLTAQEYLAKALWQFALTGEVRLMGKDLQAASVTEWASVVKWLYSYIEPSKMSESDGEPEIVIRVLRESDTPPLDGTFTSPPSPLSASSEGEQDALTPDPSPSWRGEEDEDDWL